MDRGGSNWVEPRAIAARMSTLGRSVALAHQQAGHDEPSSGRFRLRRVDRMPSDAQ
jgi:hypothetical protein